MNVGWKYKLNVQAETDDPVTLGKIQIARNYAEMRALKKKEEFNYCMKSWQNLSNRSEVITGFHILFKC